jgi:UDP-3-O-[3-hydroxymyristoyl] glucosamine N-acyltransferase
MQSGPTSTLWAICIIAGQAGVAGSTRLGMGVVVWGQVAINGHIEVGDRVTIAAQSGVAHDVPAGQRVAGLPAIDERRWARSAVGFGRLHELRREVRELMRKVARLEGEETT